MNTERLQKLAEHLLHGKLGHESFDFGIYNNTEEPFCGTAGDAIGECPIVFPEYWEFDEYGYPMTQNELDTENSGMAFFDLTLDEFEHLFYPNAQDTELYGGKRLKRNATRYEVAENILAFIKTKQK
jgi:hypothetical protein